MADERLIPAGIRDANTLALNELIDRMGTVDLTPLLVYIINDVTEAALPLLLEQFHVAGNEGGRLAENATNRRYLLRIAIELHRMKGTPAGLKYVIAAAGFGNVTIIERAGEVSYGGVASYDGLYSYGPDNGMWAEYVLIMDRAITNEQAELIAALCKEYAPARCRLRQINYTAVSLRYNGGANFDGNYNFGAI
ncbi:MAG: phage tail protein [Chlorobiaceae bacterium]|nr:phage tail protein [Chlorobiaceae bacterium]